VIDRSPDWHNARFWTYLAVFLVPGAALFVASFFQRKR
jgi:hypothetical protein